MKLTEDKHVAPGVRGGADDLGGVCPQEAVGTGLQQLAIVDERLVLKVIYGRRRRRARGVSEACQRRVRARPRHSAARACGCDASVSILTGHVGSVAYDGEVCVDVQTFVIARGGEGDSIIFNTSKNKTFLKMNELK